MASADAARRLANRTVSALLSALTGLWIIVARRRARMR
jgi:hypothetical protein